jgi:hypothetical protein
MTEDATESGLICASFGIVAGHPYMKKGQISGRRTY